LVYAINLHISYLPWNRGADPNFWSFINDTPKGITIHYVDKNYDTGDIIAQKEIGFNDNETLRTSYNKLQIEIQILFKENWDSIKNGTCKRIKQNGKGSLQRVNDKESYIKDNYFDMRISDLIDYVGDVQLSQQFTEEYCEEFNKQ
jgi:methionyl-tRNA formyltransferase